MKRSTFALLLFLVGCGVGDHENDPTCAPLCVWDGSYQEVTGNIYVQYSPARITKIPMGPRIQAWWEFVQECTGIYVTLHRPLVIKYLPTYYVSGNSIGQAYLTQNVIAVTDHDQIEGTITRHEMIHILLHYAGVDPMVNINHQSDWFDYCHITAPPSWP